MVFISGELISILTSREIIVDEFVYVHFCRVNKIVILDACFLRIGNSKGYVIYENIFDINTSFLVLIFPFFVNSLLYLTICLTTYTLIKFCDTFYPLSFSIIWLGISIGIYARLSNQDSDTIFQQAKERIKHLNILADLSFPLLSLFYQFTLFHIVWADLIYRIARGIGIYYLYFNDD